ncbi:MAG TPA: L,D-transpeptidase [Acidimicrobiia bacterium]|nr:L,D-transpeptidase [Acidimicrobiia bacterium]
MSDPPPGSHLPGSPGPPPSGGEGARALRAARRAHRSRVRAAIAAAVVLVVAIGGAGAWVLLRDDAKAAPKKKVAAPTTTALAPAKPAPAVTATVKVPEITAYQDAVETAPVVTKLKDKTEYQIPRTFLVTDQSSRPGWLNVLLPIRPNGTSGWIRASDVTIGSSDYEIKIELGAHKLTLLKLGQSVLESGVVIGKDKTPTPPGKFYVTDPLDLHSKPNAGYGVFALGISGFSDVLTSFKGGPGQLAVHGTNNPGEVGQNISNGCVRVPNDAIEQIAAQAPLGTPVTIVA